MNGRPLGMRLDGKRLELHGCLRMDIFFFIKKEINFL
jgi:hypothetical protein